MKGKRQMATQLEKWGKKVGERFPRLGKWYRETRLNLEGWVDALPIPKGWRTPAFRRRLGRALLVCSPFLITFCCQLITLRSWGRTVSWIWLHPGPVLLTVGLLLLGEAALLLAIGRPFWAVLIPSIPITLLAVASTLKELVNGTPLLLSDLSMATRAGAIAGFLHPGMGWGGGTVSALLLLILLLIAIARLCPEMALPSGRRRILGSELLCLLLAVALCAPSIQTFAAGEEGETQAGRNDRLGLLLGLYGAGVQSAMTQPGDYTEDNLNRILLELEADREPTPEAGIRPNVVLLISESFFDVTELPGLTFTRDPLLNFRALSRTWPTGTFLSNTYAGGTGNVELELITGIPSAFLGAGETITTLPDPAVYERLPSVVRAFSHQGYSTVMVHAYDDSLYNRGINLPLIGFDATVYQKDFPKGSHETGGFLSDHSLVEEMIRRFEAKGEGPIFLYGLSMENHPPYHAGKFFGDPSNLGAESTLLSQGELAVVDSLAHGIRDADAALGELLDYFAGQEEPTLVVFLGDHMPGLYLVEGESLYVTMGLVSGNNTEEWDPQEMKRMHRTDFLVWNNYGAEIEVPETVSVTQMGAKILKWAGVERPLYFQWVDQAGEEALLYRPRLFVTGDGTAYEKPPEEAEETVAAWRNMVYDVIYGQEYIAEKVMTN